MAKGYIYVEVERKQVSKKAGKQSGDVIDVHRDENATVIFFADGLGSGIKANIAATMCVSRLKELYLKGFSVRRAFNNVLATMEEAKKIGMPYSVFTVLKISAEGMTSVLSYEMPPPLFFSGRNSNPLQQRIFTVDNSIIGESNCFLRPGEGIALFSDGITNSGMGKNLPNGWGIDGVNEFIGKELSEKKNFRQLPERIINQARNNWNGALFDDCSVLLAHCIKERTIDIFSGPPEDTDKDAEAVMKFLSGDGLKIICGGTTAKIVARQTGKTLSMDNEYQGEMTPPSYSLEGIDLVTEGAVTLNQVYNIWGEEHKKLEKYNPATELYILMSAVDRIHFFLGSSKNPAADGINFVQQGILSRNKIITLLIQKLKEDGKIISITNV